MSVGWMLYLATVVLALALVVLPTPRVVGCAAAPPFGQTVQIADESAIIIWDAASKTQHFIRRAAFTTAAHDFGFLVPTPTRPELAEAGDEAFTSLANLTAPRIVTQSAPSGGGGCGCVGSAPKMAAGQANMAPAVEVLESKRVAGYDAAVLQADDAAALTKWLADHGYQSSPELTGWAEPYVKAKWKITAFKIARDDPPAKDGTGKAGPATGKAVPAPASVSVAAVRMSFHTEHPFFPYREPASTIPPPPPAPPPVVREDGKVMPPLNYTPPPPPSRRLLRVYFIAEGRMKGTLGEVDQPWDKVANARVVWANKLMDPNRESVLAELRLPKETPPAAWWLTEFEDHSSPRPGTDDVYFSTDESQATVERPPIIQYVSANLPGCVMCYALVAYLFLPCLVRRMRR